MLVSKMLVFQCAVILLFNYAATDKLDRDTQFTIEVKGQYTDALIKSLQMHDFSLLHKITPSVYIFQYEGDSNTDTDIAGLLEGFKDKIVAAEEMREYNNTLKPVHAEPDKADDELNTDNIVCDNYYGMGVPDVWKRNITGKGVTIAVNGVGLNTDLHDLERNINKSICKNFLTNTSDVTPESFSELMDKPPDISNHGNKVASIAAAVKDNNICSAGIAYEANIVALKIFRIKLYDGATFGLSHNHRTASEIIARSFVYKLDEIDIFANAWGPNTQFDQLDLATRNAIKYGATKGRGGLGMIYVVPAGPCGNELSNNIHTISVNSFGRYGTQHRDVVFDPSVLVSGLRDGNSVTASSMVTTYFNNTCVRTFSGLSAAVSQIAGIIALGLQANPKLHLRDVQHLLVQSATHTGLKETKAFQTNGKSKHFHNIFGFGLLNASKFVSLAEKHEPVSKMTSLTLKFNQSTSSRNTQTFDFYYHVCEDLSCLKFIEHVKTNVGFTTDDQLVRMEITSPSNTKSVVMDLNLEEEEKIPVTKTGTLVSVHFWGEEAFGKWIIQVERKHETKQLDVHNITLTLYGTRPDDKEDNAVEEVTQQAQTTVYIIVGVCVGILVSVIILVIMIVRYIRKRMQFQRVPQ